MFDMARATNFTIKAFKLNLFFFEQISNRFSIYAHVDELVLAALPKLSRHFQMAGGDFVLLCRMGMAPGSIRVEYQRTGFDLVVSILRGNEILKQRVLGLQYPRTWLHSPGR